MFCKASKQAIETEPRVHNTLRGACEWLVSDRSRSAAHESLNAEFLVLVRARNCSAARNSVPVPLQSTDSGRDSELRVAFAASIVGWRLPRGRVACVPHSITGSPATVTSARGAASHAAVRSRVPVLVAVRPAVHPYVRAAPRPQDLGARLQVATRGGTDEQREIARVWTRDG